MLFARRLLQRVRADMMIRDAESGRGNERAAAAGIETNARFLEMFQPLWRRLELIFVLELFERRIVEQPHSLIAKRAIAQAAEQN